MRVNIPNNWYFSKKLTRLTLVKYILKISINPIRVDAYLCFKNSIMSSNSLICSFLLRKNLIDHWHHLNQMLGYN
jgi:hypothetical protein